MHWIRHNFSTSRTQQNEVVERKSRTLQEMTRVMLHGNNLPTCFRTKRLTLLVMF